MNKAPLKKLTIYNLLKKIKISNLSEEKISLDKSLGRYLNVDLRSKINLPPFNNSAVDGYALLKNDILNKNKKLIVNQRLAAGDDNSNILGRGEAARIFTGAQMPLNSTTVVMQENVNVDINQISIIKMPHYGENCRLAGEDIIKGKKIFSKGEKINSTNINLIAAIGKKNIIVKKKLKIGFYTNGDELREPSENLKGSEINNSNSYSLKALLNKPYIESAYLGVLRDQQQIIEKHLLKSVNKFNVIITAGGASVGEEDHLIKTINKLGKLFFWKTAIKPGRPLAIGKIKNTIVICLPGNPVSVHLLYAMIIAPFLKYLCSGKFIVPKGILAKTDFTMKKKNNRLEWLRVTINKKENNLVVSKYKKQGSGMISSMVFSDGILEIPEDINLISKNDYFNFYSIEHLFD
jgi:molybdopterin molybdotransferase